MIHQDYNL